MGHLRQPLNLTSWLLHNITFLKPGGLGIQKLHKKSMECNVLFNFKNLVPGQPTIKQYPFKGKTVAACKRAPFQYPLFECMRFPSSIFWQISFVWSDLIKQNWPECKKLIIYCMHFCVASTHYNYTKPELCENGIGFQCTFVEDGCVKHSEICSWRRVPNCQRDSWDVMDCPKIFETCPMGYWKCADSHSCLPVSWLHRAQRKAYKERLMGWQKDGFSRHNLTTSGPNISEKIRPNP